MDTTQAAPPAAAAAAAAAARQASLGPRQGADETRADRRARMALGDQRTGEVRGGRTPEGYRLRMNAAHVVPASAMGFVLAGRHAPLAQFGRVRSSVWPRLRRPFQLWSSVLLLSWNWCRRAAPLIGSLALLACDNGSITLSVTDTPADEVSRVVVQFSAVEFEDSAGHWERIELRPEMQLDLLALRGGESKALIDDESIPAGTYRRIRFVIDADPNGTESYVDRTNGGRIALEPDGGEDVRPTVDFRFTLDDGDDVALTVDFDLRRGLIEPDDSSDRYRLRSALRAVDDEFSGRVSGTVSAGLVTNGCEPALYVFEGQDADVGDIGGAKAPLTSVGLLAQNGSSGLSYSIGFLEAGDYTMAFTCDAQDDDPEDDDEFSFRRERNFEIKEGAETVLDINW